VITYVDTSTLLKLAVDEAGSDRAELIWKAADTLASVGLVVVEARAALAAAARVGRLTAAQHRDAKAGVASLLGDLNLVEATAELIDRAAHLAESEALRGYDAVHLATALATGATVFTSADADLCGAADRLGLHVANPLEP
jgi:predicted nucleic acid-binding protein